MYSNFFSFVFTIFKPYIPKEVNIPFHIPINKTDPNINYIIFLV